MTFLRLRRTPKLAVAKHETDTFFVDADGVFKKMGPDGTVSEVGGSGGSLPDTGGASPANVLALNEALAPTWAPPSLQAAACHWGTTATAAADTILTVDPIPFAFTETEYDNGGFRDDPGASFVAPSDGLYWVKGGLKADFSADPGQIRFEIEAQNDGAGNNMRNVYVGNAHVLSGGDPEFDTFESWIYVDGPVRLLAGEKITKFTGLLVTGNAVDIVMGQNVRQSFSIMRVGDYPPDAA